MTVYASRMKRNLRETIEERDELLGRIRMMREVMGNYAERDPEGGKLIVEMLEYIETGRLPDDYLNAMGGMH